MKTPLLSLLILWLTSFGYSQSIQHEDLTPRYLVRTAPTLTIITPDQLLDTSFFLIPNEWYNEFPIHSPVHFGIDYFPSSFYPPEHIYGISYSIFIPKCGESYYDNGIMSSRCECDADSVFHGKSVYWDEQGRISSVAYYSKGKLYTKKSYEQGKVSSLSQYTYKDGDRVQHGKQIEYTTFGKITRNYFFGKRHGLETEHSQNQKLREDLYENDYLRESRQWSSEGQLIKEQFYDVQGYKHGRWLQFEPISQTETISEYHREKLLQSTTRKNGIIIHRIENKTNGDQLDETFYDNGNKKQLQSTLSNGLVTMQYWEENGSMRNNYQLKDGKLIGNGFMKTLYSAVYFEQVRNSDGSEYLECFEISQGDTLAFFYARNNGALCNDVIRRNHYVQKDGKAVRHREWILYENNKVVSVMNFDHGVEHGKVVLFDTTASEPIPYLTGNFVNGTKHGLWTQRTDSILINVEYRYDQLHGMYSSFRRSADTTQLATNHDLVQKNREIHETLIPQLTCSHQNNQLYGNFKTHYLDGNRHWTGVYLAGVAFGEWKEYESDSNKLRAIITFKEDGSLHRKSYRLSFKRLRKGQYQYKKRRIKSFEYTISPFIPARMN